MPQQISPHYKRGRNLQTLVMDARGDFAQDVVWANGGNSTDYTVTDYMGMGYRVLDPKLVDRLPFDSQLPAGDKTHGIYFDTDKKADRIVNGFGQVLMFAPPEARAALMAEEQQMADAFAKKKAKRIVKGDPNNPDHEIYDVEEKSKVESIF